MGQVLIEKMFFLFIMLVAAHILVRFLIDERGIFKIKSILIWICMYDIGLIHNVDRQSNGLDALDCIFIVIGITITYVYSVIYITKSKDPGTKIGAVICWIYVSFVFAVAALEIQQMELVFIFKIWLMVTLLFGLLALRNVFTGGQIFAAVFLYLIMIGSNAMLSKEFLNALIDNQPWKGIYDAVQRSYCLNVDNGQILYEDMIRYIMDFFICRIMDMILLGFLSAKFLDIISESKVAEKCSKKL